MRTDDDAAVSRRNLRGELLLVSLCGLFALCTMGIAIYTTGNHVSGKGCVFDSYWMVSLAETSTYYDWQTGYGDEPWRCWFASNRTVSGRTDPDFSFLGLRVFQPKPQRGIVHVHYALTIFLASIFPVVWFTRYAKRFAEKFGVVVDSAKQVSDRVV